MVFIATAWLVELAMPYYISCGLFIYDPSATTVVSEGLKITTCHH